MRITIFFANTDILITEYMVLRNPGTKGIASALDERSGEIFRRIVESYLESGEPLGSRNLSRLLPVSLSPASVRNVIGDLRIWA